MLRVHKPEFQKCPEPDAILKKWLYDGWESFHNEVHTHENIESDAASKKGKSSNFEEIPQDLFKVSAQLDADDENDIIIEHFSDNKARIKAYEKWMEIRNEWVEKQKIIEKTRGVFTTLYKLHVDLERDSETLEMIVANGFLRDRENNNINHPVITRRVKTEFDATSNTISIEDADVETELYSMMFEIMVDINLDSVASLRDDLRKNDYHPMDHNDMPEFMKVLVHQLSSESLFSKDGEPADWMRSNRLLLYINPVFIVRKRVDGTLKAVEHIIENITKTGYVPPHLDDIVSGGKIEIPEDDHDETVEEQLAAVGGESVDILLSKEANKEQLEIAQRIEHYNAVLVQGPPGTGKTHTIANLMGHFLAQGKSVLVTSHTKKALTVLKDQVTPGLRNLCVSVLDDSNADMEKSVDGITDYMSKNTAHELKRQMDSMAQKRRQVIADLADTRKKLFAIINQECNSIVLNGDEISPSKAAAFVLDHAGDLSYIPGNVRLYSPMPVSFADLTNLYRSNGSISVQEEPELACDLPNPDSLLSPVEYERTWQNLQTAKQHLNEIAKSNAWNIQYDNDECRISLEAGSDSFSFDYPEEASLDSLNTYIESFGSIETWMKYAAVDGKKGGAFKQRWLTLTEQIQRTCDYAESIVTEQFGKSLHFVCDEDLQEFIPIYEKMRSVLAKKGKISKLDILFNSSFEKALSAVTINGLKIQSADDCDIVLHTIELDKIRKQCSVYWNNLLSTHDVPLFFNLDDDEPERIAKRWIAPIHRYLDWYKVEFSLLSDHLSDANIPDQIVFYDDTLDSELSTTDKILSALNDIVPPILEACRTTLKIQTLEAAILDTESILQEGKRINSTACTAIIRAITNGDCPAYAEALRQLEILYTKYDLQQKRDDLLKRIAPVAPQWADAKEALSVVALLMACMKQSEYDGKTFGVISLLGDEQAKRIQNLIFEYIDAKDIERRRILCGNASNFQGDERDVVFLSVVDSGNGYGPLPKQEFGPDDAYRKRYNVAASRAKDQLWIVDSLDAANDLKPGDIRKRLIDYSLNPAAFENVSAEIEKRSESPFEAAVAKALKSRGYHLVQQWQVGAYRLDMVAVCGKNNVAIECDGERYHSGEAKIREDMERQTILERSGWRFIRIRGSEYFRDPEKTIARVIAELGSCGIEPEEQGPAITETRTSELLQRTKTLAYEIFNSFDSSDSGAVDIETIGVALSSHGAETPAMREVSKSTPNTEKSKNIKNNDQVSEQFAIKLDDTESRRLKGPPRQAPKQSKTNASRIASHSAHVVQQRSSSRGSRRTRRQELTPAAICCLYTASV